MNKLLKKYALFAIFTFLQASLYGQNISLVNKSNEVKKSKAISVFNKNVRNDKLSKLYQILENNNPITKGPKTRSERNRKFGFEDFLKYALDRYSKNIITPVQSDRSYFLFTDNYKNAILFYINTALKSIQKLDSITIYDNNGNAVYKVKTKRNSNGDLSYLETTQENGSDWLTVKLEVTYDKNGFMSHYELYQKKDINSNWTGVNYDEEDDLGIIINSISFTYNDMGLPDTMTSYKWDETTSSWSQTIKSKISYDNNDNITLWEVYGWNKSLSSWLSVLKFVYTYNSLNKLLSEEEYDWDKTTSSFINTMNANYEYNDDGQLKMLVGGEYDSNNNYKGYKYLFYYDNNQIINEYNELINPTLMEWKAEERIRYTLDNKKNLILEEESLSSNGLDWSPYENYFKYNYEYDLAGRITLYENFDWNNNNWEVTSKYTLNYNDSGNLTLIEGRSGDNDDDGLFQAMLSYDASGLINEVQFKAWNYDSSTLNTSYKLKFYNYNSSTGLEKTISDNDAKITVVNNILYINVSKPITLYVYNLAGYVVKRYNAISGVTIKDKLPAGVYIINKNKIVIN